MAKNQQPDDDAEHEVLYISPGDCKGDGGRTYGWKAAKDADERAALIDQGYSPTLEEAYKEAGKPLKDRERAKPADWKPGNRADKKANPAAGTPKTEPKDAESEEDERDPITGDDANPETPSLEDVKTALAALKEAKNTKAVTDLLKRFGAASAPKLDEAKYAEVIAAAEKAAKE